MSSYKLCFCVLVTSMLLGPGSGAAYAEGSGSAAGQELDKKSGSSGMMGQDHTSKGRSSDHPLTLPEESLTLRIWGFHQVLVRAVSAMNVGLTFRQHESFGRLS